MATEKIKIFEELFQLHYKELFVHAYSFLNNEEDSKDIVNDVFEYVWDNFQKFDISTSLKPLLYTYTRNRCVDFLRKQKSKEKYLTYQIFHEMQQTDDVENYDQLIEKIKKEIEAMPTQRSIAFKKCFLEGKKYQEAADEMNVSINTIRTHIVKSLSHLRERISTKEMLMLLLLLNKNQKK